MFLEHVSLYKDMDGLVLYSLLYLHDLYVVYLFLKTL